MNRGDVGTLLFLIGGVIVCAGLLLIISYRHQQEKEIRRLLYPVSYKVKLVESFPSRLPVPLGAMGKVITEGATGRLVQVEFEEIDDLDFTGGRYWVPRTHLFWYFR